MKNKILLLLMVFAFFYSNAQEDKTYYPVSNNLKKSGELDKNGFPVGEWIFYLENGATDYKINFTTNFSKKYYETGELKEAGKFDPGTGDFINEKITYHKNGKIKVKGMYNNDGKKNGEFKTFFEDGTLVSCELFIEGVKQN